MPSRAAVHRQVIAPGMGPMTWMPPARYRVNSLFPPGERFRLYSAASYERGVHVVGKSRAIRLANAGSADVCGAARALLAELVEAQWRSPQEAVSAYPCAEVKGHRLFIPLDSRHCVIVAVNYALGLALIEHAGLCIERTSSLSPVGSKVRP